MTLALTAYGISAGYALAYSHSDTNKGTYLAPRVNPPGGFFASLTDNTFADSTGSTLVRVLGTDGSTTPVTISTLGATQGIVRMGGVAYAAMVGKGTSGPSVTAGKQFGIGTLADDGTLGHYDIAYEQNPAIITATPSQNYFPHQLTADPSESALYLALSEGTTAQGTGVPFPRRLRIIQIPLIGTLPVAPTTWLDLYGPLASGTIAGFTDSRAATLASLALSPDGLMIYAAVRAMIGQTFSRIVGYQRSDKSKTFDIPLTAWVNGILIGAAGLDGKMLIHTATGIDEYVIATGASNQVVSGNGDTGFSLGFAAFGTNEAYFHALPTAGGAGFSLAGTYKLTVPGLVGVDPGEPDPPDPEPGAVWELNPAPSIPANPADPPGPVSLWDEICSGPPVTWQQQALPALPGWTIETPGQ